MSLAAVHVKEVTKISLTARKATINDVGELVFAIKGLDITCQVSIKDGSSFPVRCSANWAKSAESKYAMLTLAAQHK